VTGEGEWIPVGCWAHCGSKCYLKAYVVDNTVIRLQTDDTHEDSQEFPQRRACVRGRSRRMDVFSADRIKYPMKRKSWQPGGGENAHGELRGTDEWERISWEEALDTIAKEITRIKDKHGNRAIFTSGNNFYARFMTTRPEISPTIKGCELSNVFNLYGGSTYHSGTASAGAFLGAPLYGFGMGAGSDFVNDRLDARSCDYCIMIGLNTGWSGNNTNLWANWVPLKEAGVKFFSIDPMYTDSAAVLEAEWIPARPGTDVTMLMAMAYVMITEDDPVTNPIINWDVIERCTIGFDKDHMPEGEDPTKNFKDHILGTYDGQPKDPEWASQICGIEPDTIRRLARIMRKDNKVALLSSWAPARGNNQEYFVQMLLMVGAAMGGHFGKSGHMTSATIRDGSINGGPRLVSAGSLRLPNLPNPVDDIIQDGILWKSILDKKYNFTGWADLPGETRDIDIHCIYHHSLNVMHRSEALFYGIKAHRQMDLVVTHAMNYNENARYSDFILPVSTPWENPWPWMITSEHRESCIFGRQAVQPMYEGHSDQWIGRELLKRWGIDEKKAFPYTELQQAYNQLSGSTVLQADGMTKKPLLSFTQADLDYFGVDYAEPNTDGVLTYEEFKQVGVYSVPRKEGDNFGHIAFKGFREDPENNPMGSKSGKMEFYSTYARDFTKGLGYSEPLSPVPTYGVLNGYEYTFENNDYKNGKKGEYPFQIYNPHYFRTAHAHFDNVTWMREAAVRPIYISQVDADAKGIKDGDTVKVYNQHGAVLRPACVTNRITPGVIALPHGGWIEMDEENQVDKGGSNNTLTAPVTTGVGTSGYNTNVCNVELWTKYKLTPDAQRPNQIPNV
jgi:anaerobic dimethyl sulfoxide reductase subunit A